MTPPYRYTRTNIPTIMRQLAPYWSADLIGLLEEQLQEVEG